MKDPFVPVARALGTTVGQAWTLALGLLLGLLLLAVSLPPVWERRPPPAPADAPVSLPHPAPGALT